MIEGIKVESKSMESKKKPIPEDSKSSASLNAGESSKLSDLTVKDLRELLKEKSLSTTGTKAVMIDRLLNNREIN
jgi:hypothetical protein